MKKHESLKQWIYVALGSMILAVAYVLFISPYHIIPGGLFGIAIALNYMFPTFEIGSYTLMMDIPVMITSFIIFGSKAGKKTIGAAIMCPVFTDTLTYIIGDKNPVTMLSGTMDLSNDILLSCVFGGVLMGVGVSLILKAHATSGGTDTIALIVSKYMKMPVSRAILIVDSVVIVFGLLVFQDWKIPLYSLVTIFVFTKVVDLIIDGGSGDKLLFILSEKNDQIREYIINDLQRGGTFIKSAGMYTNAPREMIFVVIARSELSIVQDYVKETDPRAFLVVVNAHETVGDGFKKFTAKIGG